MQKCLGLTTANTYPTRILMPHRTPRQRQHDQEPTHNHMLPKTAS